MSDSKLHVYEGQDVTVTFDKGVCTHAAECVKGLPGVFDIEKRPWVQPDNAKAEEVRRQVAACPSGALQVIEG